LIGGIQRRRRKPMPCLGRAFFDAVDVFNTTFAKANPPAPTLNNFAPYYDPNITMHTPHVGIQRPRGQVLSNLAASAPLYFDPSVSNLQIDENAGIVKGNTMYTDTDQGQTKTFGITFEIHYRRDPTAPGGWIVREAFSR
jgi:hypothetical protein